MPRLFLLTIVFLKRLILAGSALRQSKQSLIEDFVNLWLIFHSSLEFDMKFFFVKEKLIGVMVHLLSFHNRFKQIDIKDNYQLEILIYQSRINFGSPSSSYIFVLFCLLRTCSFHILPISIENFCNEAFVEPGSCLKVVWISEIICLTKDNFQIQTYSSKDFHKSMLKSWNFAKITSATDALIIICWKLSKEIFLKTPPDRSFC